MGKIRLNKDLVSRLVFYTISVVLAIVFLILSYTVFKSQYKQEMFIFDNNKWILFSVYLFLGIINAYKIYFEAFQSLFKGKITEKTLIVIATISAFIIGEYFEALMIIILFNYGELIEDITRYKTNQHLEILKKSSPQQASLITKNNRIQLVPIKELKIGDFIQLKPGDIVPIDCEVVNGIANIDISSLNGESKYCDVSKGTYLHSGAINVDGDLTCLVKKIAVNSYTSYYFELIKDTSKHKSSSEKFITNFAKIYTPIVIFVAILITIIPICIDHNTWGLWLNVGLSVLLASCPCAFLVSIPVAYFASTTVLTKNSTLVKEQRYIDNLAKCDAIVFDKTGTLTTGEFKINSIKVFDKKYTEQNVIDLIGSCELHSSHILAKSVISKMKNTKKIINAKSLSGRGIVGLYNNKQIIVGNKRLMDENKINMDREFIQQDTCIYLAIDNKFIGVINFKDDIKHDAKRTIDNLKNMGIKHFYILSGDTQNSVDFVAKELNINNAYGNLLSEDKVKIFKQIKKQNKRVVFVGDGINDAPVLKLSDVGVAIDQGHDVVKQTADIVILTNNLIYMRNEFKSLNYLISVAKKTYQIVKFNTCIIIVFKLLAILAIVTLSVLVYYHVIADQTTVILLLGIFADVGLTLITTIISFSLFSTCTMKKLHIE